MNITSCLFQEISYEILNKDGRIMCDLEHIPIGAQW